MNIHVLVLRKVILAYVKFCIQKRVRNMKNELCLEIGTKDHKCINKYITSDTC